MHLYTLQIQNPTVFGSGYGYWDVLVLLLGKW